MSADTKIHEILLLEDSELDAELIGEHLRRGGIAHDILRVWAREAFVAALEARHYDLIIADYVLPSFDGMSALEIAHERVPDTPFIFVSGTLGEDTAIESLKRGATDYVVKQRLNRLPSAVTRAFAEIEAKLARRRAEDQLRAVNATLEITVQDRTRERDLVWRVSQDLFVICGFDGLYRSVNPAWNEALGYVAEELVGTSFDALVHPDDLVALHAEFERLIHGAVVRDFDIRLRASGGAYRWYSWTCVPTADEIFYAAGRDVTERTELETQLRQVQKMESIGQLTGGVAHDFNNLLTVVIGNLETLQRQAGTHRTEREKNAIENAMRGAQRAAKLTQSLLAFSRRQPLDPRQVDANILVGGMSDLLGRTLGEQVEIRTVLAPDLWWTHADPNQLENAILNLAVNARDAMGDGVLTISTSNILLDRTDCGHDRDITPGEYVVITVNDTGPGMSPEVMAQAFEPFFTTKGVGHGTGLGLSQVYGFVKQSGGHVKIDSQAGRGTSVRIYLPRLVAVEAKIGEARPAEVLRSQTGTETILVVEDDEDVRRHSTAIVRELGYDVLEAFDGASALDIVDAHPEIRLLFTDIGLPNGMDGRQLADEARRRRPRLKVLFATAYARSAILDDGRLEPGVQLVTKPYTFAIVAERLRKILDAQSPIPRILIVEDEPLVRMVAVDTLEAAGYRVEEAGSAAEAMSKMRLVDGGIDAVIVDIGLPDRKGDLLAADMRAERADLPIVIASGYDGAETRQTFDGDRLVGFIGKPYEGARLIAALGALGVPRLPDR